MMIMHDGTKHVIRNTLPLIVWKPEYNLGVHIVDEHHRGILAAINSLYCEMQQKKCDSILVPVFRIMYEFARIHFKIEEEFFDKLDFPDAVSHRALHNELMETLSEVGSKSILNRDPHQFMNFQKKWWIDHICDKDRLFRNYLLGKPFIEEEE
jgi:hemerythrin